MAENEHLKVLSNARKKLIAERHRIAGSLAMQEKIMNKDDKSDLVSQFIKVQTAIDAIDRAIQGEQQMRGI